MTRNQATAAFTGEMLQVSQNLQNPVFILDNFLGYSRCKKKFCLSLIKTFKVGFNTITWLNASILH